jgi:chemotaxis protein methyltransferase CheR
VNIWCAGCSTGEEIYSLAITLQETGLLERSVIYATDINPRALKAAREGIFSVVDMQRNIRNYQESGGSESFSRYYTADYGLAKMDSDLMKNTVFSEHNLAVDHVFAECHLVVCRNVLIYFNKQLQERVFSLFTESLRYGGFLALGSKETLRFSGVAASFESTDEKWRVYRKIANEGSKNSRGVRG